MAGNPRKCRDASSERAAREGLIVCRPVRILVYLCGRASDGADQAAPTEPEAGWSTRRNWSSKDGVTKVNIQNALATYERTLITPDSRFDRYLRGEPNAISDAEKAGYLKFKQYGCIACHQGVNVGGNMFQKFGVMGDYFAQRGNPTVADMGRYLVTGEEDDKHVFKVPSLRNVEILVNLLSNARRAMDGVPDRSHQITLRMGIVELADERRLQIRVEDNGEGIAPENLPRLFSHGFTTRKNGHGFGLHSSALAAKEMSGTLTAHSDGPGTGAVFSLELPINPAEEVVNTLASQAHPAG